MDRMDWRKLPSFEKVTNTVTYIGWVHIMAVFEQAEASRFDLKLCYGVINL